MKHSAETQVTPRMAEALARYAAGPDLADAVAGDLEERMRADGCSRTWYWRQALCSAPALVRMRWSALTAQQRWLRAGLALSGLAMLWLWEVHVAQAWSWPMAQQLLHWSPLTPAQTCKACYVLFYAAPLAVCLALLSSARSLRTLGIHRSVTVSLVLSAVALVPVVYYWMFPGPYDGPRDFRVYQAISVLLAMGVCALVALSRRNPSGLAHVQSAR